MTSVPPFALEICIVCVGIFLLMMDCFTKLDKRSIGLAAIAGLLAAFVLSFLTGPMPSHVIPPSFYVADAPALFFKRFVLLSTALTIALALDYAPIYERFIPSASPQAGVGEFFILPVFTCAGLMWMVSAADFVMIFVSLELVTVTFYVLVASMRKNTGSLEAGVKYLILGALSTGFLVYGITWVFGITGQTSLEGIRQQLPLLTEGSQAAVLFGLGLVLVALGFKVAAVPFQFWVPDVYQGAPTPITAFLSVASKAAGFIVLLRVLEPFFTISSIERKLLIVLTLLAALTLVYGNLAAMPQTNLKRLLGYSSIAHAGYLLIGVASFRGGPSGPAIGFYLAGYFLMTFLAFLVLQHVAMASGGDDISDFNGLGSRSPVLALGMLISMLSLAGLPFTVGFLGKFLIFEAAMRSQQYLLVAIGAVTVASGFYYYLKVVRAMYWQPAPDGASSIPVPGSSKFLIGVFCAAIILLGIFPQPLIAMLN
ncbi:MAG TPA: NADH-quinone oxidoreductase subunit N [Terrimicrobiaceae bacterium]|jgi:NADH-quinone oxidoreductase subunit N|nr:NADH-quinone oxidoreductase subunit N [Terrimicrobiaceae bacterium]